MIDLSTIYTEEGYEKASITKFRELCIERGYKNFVDIGAGFGLYTKIGAEVMKEGTIYAFEPDKFRFDYLNDMKTEWETNTLNIIVSDLAIGKIKETEEFFICEERIEQSGSLIKDFPKYVQKSDSEIEFKITKVNIETLDNLFSGTEIDIIKIDTEGNEYNVLLGARNLLKETKPAIILEIHPEMIMGKFSDIRDLMNGYNYRMQYTDNDHVIFSPIGK